MVLARLILRCGGVLAQCADISRSLIQRAQKGFSHFSELIHRRVRLTWSELLPELDEMEGTAEDRTVSWNAMLNDDWGVAKVKGVEPEHFFVFLINPQGFKGPFMRTSGFLSEEELRADLKIKGRTDVEIDALFEGARANPV